MSNKYSELSNFEINKLVAERLGGYAGSVGDWMPDGVKQNEDGGTFYSERDYCGKDADCMPIAWENKISIE